MHHNTTVPFGPDSKVKSSLLEIIIGVTVVILLAVGFGILAYISIQSVFLQKPQSIFSTLFVEHQKEKIILFYLLGLKTVSLSLWFNTPFLSFGTNQEIGLCLILSW